VERSTAVIYSVSQLLVVVMGLKNALMAVMRLTVVSYHPGLAIIITAIAYCLYCTDANKMYDPIEHKKFISENLWVDLT